MTPTPKPWRPAGTAHGIASLALVGILMAGACRHPPEGSTGEGGVICYVGTAAYRQRVEGFKVQPEAARKLLAAHLDAQPPPRPPGTAARVFVGSHTLIVGEAYHFYLPRKSGGIPRTGYYVNGDSGTVEFKVVPGTVPYP